MGLYDKVLSRLLGLLDLPDQTLPGVPILEIYGDERVLIEGQCVVTEYDSECIKLRNGVGIISVCGCGLKMTELSNKKLIIAGKIQNISIARG